MMETIQMLIKWFQDANNVRDVLAVLGAVYTISLFIVKLTPTPKDDEWLSKIYKIVHGVIGKLGVKK